MIAPPFLTSALAGTSAQLQSPAILPTEEIVTVTHWIGSCLGRKIGMDDVDERKMLFLLGIEPETETCSSSLYRLISRGSFLCGYCVFSVT
jgi:hypothetical protein